MELGPGKTRLNGAVLLGLGPQELESHGETVVDVMDRLNAKISWMHRILVLTGEGATIRYTGRPSVLLTSEDTIGAAAALRTASKIYGVERLEYVATPEESDQMEKALRRGITVVPHTLDSLPRILNLRFCKMAPSPVRPEQPAVLLRRAQDERLACRRTEWADLQKSS